MKVFRYETKDELIQKSKELGYKIFQTPVSVSFRIFENRYTTELHIHYFNN